MNYDIQVVGVVPRSHQSFRPGPTVKLLGIMLRNRCWPTTFHTVIAGDADGLCLKLASVINPSV